MISAAISPSVPSLLFPEPPFRAPSWAYRGAEDRATRRPRPNTPAPAELPRARLRRAELVALDDAALLTEVLGNHPSAFRVFYDRYRRLMMACINRAAGRAGVRLQADDLADVLGDCCANMVAHDYRRLRLYRPDGGCSVSSWVGVIATSTAQDFLRRERRRRLEPTHDAELERVAPCVEGPDVALMDREERSFVDTALERFSKRDRRFVELYFLEALAPEAIAEELGVSVSTVYSKKAKIKTKLRALARAAA